MYKKLAIHGSIILVVMIIGDFTLNEGRGSETVFRDMNPTAMFQEGKRRAYHTNAFINRNTGSD